MNELAGKAVVFHQLRNFRGEWKTESVPLKAQCVGFVLDLESVP